MYIFKKEQLRFNEIDFLKGMAIITMVISHIFYFKYQMNMSDLDFNSGWYRFLTKFAQFVFITCIGINLSLSFQKNTTNNTKTNNTNTNNTKTNETIYVKKQLSRVMIIGIFAMILSFLTYLTHGYKYVKFGILHFASIAIFIMMWFVKCNSVVGCILIIVCMSYVYKNNENIINLSTKYVNPFIIFIIGIFNPQYYSLDYFPLIPWIAFVCAGILIGNYMYKNYERQYSINENISKFISNKNNIISPFILLLGKYSFLVYLLHIPILYMLLTYIKQFVL